MPAVLSRNHFISIVVQLRDLQILAWLSSNRHRGWLSWIKVKASLSERVTSTK